MYEAPKCLISCPTSADDAAPNRPGSDGLGTSGILGSVTKAIDDVKAFVATDVGSAGTPTSTLTYGYQGSVVVKLSDAGWTIGGLALKDVTVFVSVQGGSSGGRRFCPSQPPAETLVHPRTC